MAHVDQAPRLAGRAVSMMLSPLPKEQRKRHFYLSHGNLVDPDDEGDEDVEFDDDDEHVDDAVAEKTTEADTEG